MATNQRIAWSAGLLVLAGVAVLFLGAGDVTRCLGPLGRTEVEALRDGCISLHVGVGIPIGALAFVAAVLCLQGARGGDVRRRFAGAVAASAAGLAAYWLFRPISFTGPTSTGENITVQLSVDWAAFATAGIVGAGVGWLLSMLLRRGRSSIP